MFRCGYLRVVLYNSGNRNRYFVHHLVLNAFVGPCSVGMQACHGNGNSQDNRAINLRWDTRSNNNLEKAKHGTRQHGERNGNSKFISTEVKEIRRLLKLGIPQRQIAKQFNTSQSQVSDIGLRNTWSHI